MKKEIKLKINEKKCKIIIKHNYLLKYLNNLIKTNDKVFCLLDKKLKYIFNDFKNLNKINIVEVDGGEKVKNFTTYKKLCDQLLLKNIDRNSTIIAIGGGTIGDLSGFIASTILRGVKFILIPTTLLSQVDSSIGGKNGINSKYGKNLIGSFYNPDEVLIDTNLLKTLPLREIKSGYSEIVKHAIIQDKKFFNWLDKNYMKIFNLSTKELEYAIYKSINIKLYYVKKDLKEKLFNKNSRANLNFGHSIGHALETFYNYSNSIKHGEAISVGMIIEAKISTHLGFLQESEFRLLKNHFKKANLKIYNKNIKNKKLIELIKKDKKNINNIINIILLRKIGSSFYYKNLELKKLKKIIEKI